MDKKAKRQKRRLIFRVSAVLISAWLVVSCAFSVLVLHNTKTVCASRIQTEENLLLKSFGELNAGHLQNLQHYVYLEKYNGVTTPEKIIDGRIYYKGNQLPVNKDLQITLHIKDYNEDTTEMFMNTDTDTFCLFTAIENGVKCNYSGTIDFNAFRASMTDDQYDSICGYLSIPVDYDNGYHELICSEFYYNMDNGRIIPNAVKIVYTKPDHTWYSEDTPVTVYRLNPTGIEGLDLKIMATDKRNVIEDAFVLNEMNTGNIERFMKTETPLEYKFYENSGLYRIVNSRGTDSTEKLSVLNMFNFIYTNSNIMYIEHYGFEECNDLVLADDEHYHKDPIVINYTKQFNILNESTEILVWGLLSITLFFLIIGILLTVMLWKIMKTQIQEEQKRRDITNALAHDIKTPLFIIEGYSQSLKENINNEKRDYYAERIIERTKEVNEMVHKMIDFSRLDSFDYNLRREELNVNALINDVLTDFNPLPHQKSIEIKNPATCNINADRKLMKRAFSNLIENALKYSDNSSVITIETDSEKVRISNLCTNITENELKHIEEPFYRVDKTRIRKGNGLGLSAAKSIAQMHGFKLNLSLENHVFTVTITF